MRHVLFVLLFGLAAGHAAPTLTDVNVALARAYGGAVTAETGRPPSFIAGDFNWDGSEDLAVIVKPVDGRLDAINSEVANWVLEDPTKVRLPDFLPRAARLPAPTRAVITKDDTLVAVIHGQGPDGWRSREIAHFYLLKRTGTATLRAWSRTDFYAATKNAPRRVRTVRGDVIGETRGNARGFLVYAGGKYGWYGVD
jgi:hypothetical protein